MSEDIVTWPETLHERKAMLHSVAVEMKAAGTAQAPSWRGMLSTVVATRCGLNGEGRARVYNFIGSMSTDDLDARRAACVGEKAAQELKKILGSRGRGRRLFARDLDALKSEWAPKFRDAIAQVMEAKLLLTRTEIAKHSVDPDEDFQLAYRILRRCSDKELYELGYPPPGQYRASAIGSDRTATDRNRPPKPDDEDAAGPSVDSKARIREIEAKLLATADKLPPDLRNVKALAAAVRKPPWQIAGFVSGCEKLARKLTDGEQVLNGRFLFKPA